MNAHINKKLVRRLVLFHIAVIALANYAVQFTASVGGYDSPGACSCFRWRSSPPT